MSTASNDYFLIILLVRKADLATAEEVHANQIGNNSKSESETVE